MIVVEFISHDLQYSPSISPLHQNFHVSIKMHRRRCRLEMMVDDDDGDEVNWSMEHESRPI
jgi:hypothetical protein